jgi:hypothetical protein
MGATVSIAIADAKLRPVANGFANYFISHRTNAGKEANRAAKNGNATAL